MPLYPKAFLFQHKHLPFLNRSSLKLSGLLKASVATNAMVNRPVQTEVVRFGIWPLKYTGCVELDDKSLTGQIVFMVWL
jgi:hypothetical protein